MTAPKERSRHLLRRTLALVLVAFALVGAAPKEKQAPIRDVTGLEWLEMSVGARTDQIIASMMRLGQEGVPLAYPPDAYYRAVHESVRRDPSLYKASVTSIVARQAYEKEAEARPALDAWRGRRASSG